MAYHEWVSIKCPYCGNVRNFHYSNRSFKTKIGTPLVYCINCEKLSISNDKKEWVQYSEPSKIINLLGAYPALWLFLSPIISFLIYDRGNFDANINGIVLLLISIILFILICMLQIFLETNYKFYGEISDSISRTRNQEYRDFLQKHGSRLYSEKIPLLSSKKREEIKALSETNMDQIFNSATRI